ncbi:MAG: hypothetical protein OES69_14095, partial [Myxococcales bacterium]|nr:hypothetical protein [Myxococcales bacterium]
ASDFKSLALPNRRIPSQALADANLGGVVSVRTKRAKVAASDFKSLALPNRRIPSQALADANLGGVVWFARSADQES